MAIPWRIELLGRLRATHGERVITRFRTHKTGALLAYLAYDLHRPHPREDLVELFWPESNPEDGRHSLSQALSALRSLLEPPEAPRDAIIVADRASVQLNLQAVTTDVAEFHAALRAARRCGSDAGRIAHLTAAVEQFGGELLPGHVEQWVLLERQRLHEALFRAIDTLIAHHEVAGDLDSALALARRAVSVDPLREEAHREVIRLLHTLGRPDDALREYRALERLLREGLDTPPSADVRSLVTEPRPARSLASDASDAGADHLPVFLTRFFGRDDEIARLCRLFLGEGDRDAPGAGQTAEQGATRDPARLVALTGPGGSGKTRLAVEAARRMIPAWSEAASAARPVVQFVSLADLTDPARIPDLIRDAMGLPRSPQAEALEQVVARLIRRPTLLLLDNFERLVEGGASIVRQLLERVPSLTCLVTSRRSLGVAGEQEQIVLPLPVPDGGDHSPLAALAAESPECRARSESGRRLAETRATSAGQEERSSDWQRITASPSVQLFADRAQSACPDFAVTPENAAAVAALCRRLEGVPLAIELAAGRASVLIPEQMLERLEGPAHTSPVLTQTRGEAHERHRSLRATLDWSYRLLSPELQRFFARLSVFRGGWTEEAAEAVCEEPLALDYLAQLRDCWLVLPETFRVRSDHPGPVDPMKAGGGLAQRAPDAGTVEVRFRMLETVREYAGARLLPDERSDLERRHAEYFAALLVRHWKNLIGPEQPIWFDRLGLELENLRLACDWSVTAGASEVALRIGNKLCWFLGMRGHNAEARARAEQILALPGASFPSAGRGHLLQATGLVAFWRGDYPAARAYYEESLAIKRGIDEPDALGWLLSDMGLLERDQANLERARDCFEESLAIFQRLGRDNGVAAQLHLLGSVAHIRGDFATARTDYEESAAISRPWGDSMILATAFHGLGDIARLMGRFSEARDLLEEARACYFRLGLPMGVAWLVEALSEVAFDLGDWPEAARLCEQSLEMARELGNTWHVAASLTSLGRISCVQGDTERAAALVEQGLRIYREQGSALGEAWALHVLGDVTRRRGDHAEATARCRQALAIQRDVGYKVGIVENLRALAAVAGVTGEPWRAACLLGAAAQFNTELGTSLPPALHTEHEARLRSLRAALGEHGFAAAWEAGQTLSWEDAVAYALGERDLPAIAPGAGGHLFPVLTEAQWGTIRPLLPSRATGGRPRVEDRRALNGILYRIWSGCRWRHLPREYGSPTTCWRRLTEWRASGLWDRIRNAFLATLDDDARAEWEALFATSPALASDARPPRAARPAADERKPS